MNVNSRTIKKRQGNERITVQLADIAVGDFFIMFDDDGTQVGREWRAESAPYLKDGVWEIDAKEYIWIHVPKDKNVFSALSKRYSELHEKLKNENDPTNHQNLIDEIVDISNQFETGIFK